MIHRELRPHRHLVTVAIAAVVSLALATSHAEPPARNTGAAKKKSVPPSLVPGGIQWQASFESALALAKKKEKPLLVDFETEWCGFCKKLDRETYGNDQVIRFVQQFFVAVKVDGDKRPDLRNRYGVEGYPTILFLSPHAVEFKRIVGFRPPADFLEEAGKAARSSITLKKLKEEAAAHPDDADAQRALARALFAGGNTSEALTVLDVFRKKHPEARGVRLDLGDILKATGQLEDACTHYEAVLRDAKTLDAAEGAERSATRSAYLSLARTRLKLRQYEQGVAVLTEFLKLEPEAAHAREEAKRTDRLEALFLRAYAHATSGHADEALADLKTAEELDTEGFWGLRASLIRELVETPPERP